MKVQICCYKEFLEPRGGLIAAAPAFLVEKSGFLKFEHILRAFISLNQSFRQIPEG